MDIANSLRQFAASTSARLGLPRRPVARSCLHGRFAASPTFRRRSLTPMSTRSRLREGSWEPAKHPRGAFPQNRGWWSPTGDASGGGPSSGEPPTTPPPTTKSQLPADSRGAWVSGTEGNGVFRYNNSVQNQQAGLAGKEVRFEHGNIAIGGFPPESYYGGNANIAGVDIGEVTGFEADNLAADAQMRKKLRQPRLAKAKRLPLEPCRPTWVEEDGINRFGHSRTSQPQRASGRAKGNAACEPWRRRFGSRGGGADGIFGGARCPADVGRPPAQLPGWRLRRVSLRR